MFRYVIKRILWLIPIVIAVSFIVYALLDLAPGDIVDTMSTGDMSQEDLAALRASYDLDKPMIYRYGKYMFNLVQGNLGVSDLSKISVWDTYTTRLPNTLLLAASSLIFGSVCSVPLGIFAAKRAGRLADNAVTTFSLIGMSMPSFWLGLLLLLLFSLKLGWLPAGGNRAGMLSLILPTVCSGLGLMANATRQTRSSMVDVLNADYLRTARAKGVPEKYVIRQHALGNAWIPILTTIGSALAFAISGSAIIESVFAWPGVGRMMVEATMQRDVTTTLGCAILTTFMYVIVQLIVDLAYAFVDPRIKSQYSGANKKRKLAISGQADSRGVPEIMLPVSDSSEARPMETEASAGNAAAGLNAAISAVSKSETNAVNEIKPDITAAAPRLSDSERAHLASVVTRPEIDVVKRTRSEKTDSELTEIIKKYKKRSRLGEIAHSISKNKGAMTGAVIITILIITFIISLFIPFQSVATQNISERMSPPSLQHLFGTDNLGRDSFLRVIFGTRYSLAIGFGTMAFAVFFGVMLGSIAGFFGGITENLIMRFTDIMSSIPGILFGMVLMTSMGQNLQNLILAVGITSIPIFIRITRASILTVRNNEFVEAARATGLSNFRAIFTQVLPNGLSPIIVTVSMSLGMSVLVAAALSYMGFGVQVPHPEWGTLISTGREFARSAPWITTFPGLAIMFTVLGFNLLGDGLRDALDPKLKR